jgi:pimeloyl-ACP methyl ester carboxylesterase
MSAFVDKLVFPAPAPTYNKETFKKHLCWIPWNEAVSPDKVNDEMYAEGIPCMWLPAPKAAGVILFCHGNAEDLGMCFPFVRHMRDQFKMNVLAVEYPGYGLLHGVPVCEAALKEVALTAFRFILDELKVAYEQVILFGRSVGSGPTVYLASRFPVGGLILVAAFASVREAAKSLVGGLIAHLLDERFPNIALIGNVSCPTLFIHGEKDNLVPPSHSVALFKHCRARKLLITPPGMEHNTNLFTDAQFLAVPAINFFGLPGYQQESPPQMPQRFFDDGRQAFLLRKAARRKLQGKAEGASGGMGANPWFFLCGCPTTRTKPREGGTWDNLPLDRQPCDPDPDGTGEFDTGPGLDKSMERPPLNSNESDGVVEWEATTPKSGA